MYNIGEKIKYRITDGIYTEIRSGKIKEISSDVLDDVKMKYNKLVFWSLKKKSYLPVKEKKLPSIYFTVTRGSNLDFYDFVTLDEII